jgi:hypothetical protein
MSIRETMYIDEFGNRRYKLITDKVSNFIITDELGFIKEEYLKEHLTKVKQDELIQRLDALEETPGGTGDISWLSEAEYNLLKEKVELTYNQVLYNNLRLDHLMNFTGTSPMLPAFDFYYTQYNSSDNTFEVNAKFNNNNIYGKFVRSGYEFSPTVIGKSEAIKISIATLLYNNNTEEADTLEFFDRFTGVKLTTEILSNYIGEPDYFLIEESFYDIVNFKLNLTLDVKIEYNHLELEGLIIPFSGLGLKTIEVSNPLINEFGYATTTIRVIADLGTEVYSQFVEVKKDGINYIGIGWTGTGETTALESELYIYNDDFDSISFEFISQTGGSNTTLNYLKADIVMVTPDMAKFTIGEEIYLPYAVDNDLRFKVLVYRSGLVIDGYSGSAFV